MVEDRKTMVSVIPDSMLLCEVSLRYEARVGNPEHPKLDSRFPPSRSPLWRAKEGRGNDRKEWNSARQARALQKRFLKLGYKFCLFLFLPAFIVFLTPSCRNKNNIKQNTAPPLTETISSGPIELTIIADPAQVHLDRDILLTLRVYAPSNMEVRLPSLENRLKGFVLNGAFTRDAVDAGNKPVKEYCFRLTPTLADEYRIAPMAITWINRIQTPPAGSPTIAGDQASPERPAFSEASPKASFAQASAKAGGWFATRPLLFQTAGISKGLPSATIHDITGPVWIYPAFKTVALWALAIAGVAGAFYLLWWLSRRIHKTIKLRRMSPRERALYELSELLAQDLIAKQKIKEFYLELTMIVRSYIERAHAIRAPEQTTEEFLVAVTRNPGFTREVVTKLKIFLQTSDLVKFAAYRPEQKIIDQTLSTARDYIETDEKAKQDNYNAKTSGFPFLA